MSDEHYFIEAKIISSATGEAPKDERFFQFILGPFPTIRDTKKWINGTHKLQWVERQED